MSEEDRIKAILELIPRALIPKEVEEEIEKYISANLDRYIRNYRVEFHFKNLLKALRQERQFNEAHYHPEPDLAVEHFKRGFYGLEVVLWRNKKVWMFPFISLSIKGEPLTLYHNLENKVDLMLRAKGSRASTPQRFILQSNGLWFNHYKYLERELGQGHYLARLERKVVH